MASSAAFARTERPARFLRHLVNTSLRGENQLLKESLIGVHVFERPASWDPRLDPVVRQEAARLRKRIARYYETEGASDPLRIELPVGTYVPVFNLGARRECPITASITARPPRTKAHLKWIFAALLLTLLTAGVSVKGWYPWRHGDVNAQQGQAEDLYLRGIHAWQRRTPESLTRAVDLFTQAIVHDPGNANAYVGLANCYNLLREFSRMPEQEAYPRALVATQRALELNDRLAEGHASLAFISIWWNWNATAADREFRRAIELDPKYATAHHWYATFLLTRREFQKALDQITLAQRLEPSSTSILADKALILFDSGRTEEALNLLRDVTKADDDLQSSHLYLTSIYAFNNNYADYLNELKHTANISRDKVWQEMARAAEAGFSRRGRSGMLDSLLTAQKELYRSGLQSEFDLAVTAARSGRKIEAVQYLESAAERRSSSGVLFYRVDPAFRNLYSYPEFQRFDAEFGRKLWQGLFPPRELSAREGS